MKGSAGWMNEWKKSRMNKRNKGWMNTCKIEQGLGRTEAGGMEEEESWLFR